MITPIVGLDQAVEKVNAFVTKFLPDVDGVTTKDLNTLKSDIAAIKANVQA